MSYTSSFVLLDYPAASLPVRNVTRDDLEEEMEGEVLGSWDRINRELCEYSPCMNLLPVVSYSVVTC